MTSPIFRLPPKPEAMGCGTKLSIGFWVMVGLWLLVWLLDLTLGPWLIGAVEVPVERYMREVVENYGLDMLKGAKARAADTQRIRSEFVAIRVDMTESQRAALVAKLDASSDDLFSKLGPSPFMLASHVHRSIDWWPAKESIEGREWDLSPIGKGYSLEVFVPEESLSAFFVLVPRVFYIEP